MRARPLTFGLRCEFFPSTKLQEENTEHCNTAASSSRERERERRVYGVVYVRQLCANECGRRAVASEPLTSCSRRASNNRSQNRQQQRRSQWSTNREMLTTWPLSHAYAPCSMAVMLFFTCGPLDHLTATTFLLTDQSTVLSRRSRHASHLFSIVCGPSALSYSCSCFCMQGAVFSHSSR